MAKYTQPFRVMSQLIGYIKKGIKPELVEGQQYFLLKGIPHSLIAVIIGENGMLEKEEISSGYMSSFTIERADKLIAFINKAF